MGNTCVMHIWAEEGEKSLWDALPSWQRDALEMLSKAFPGSEWVLLPDEAQKDSEAA